MTSTPVADRVVAMAGDGINDAPAVTKAGVDIAIGTSIDMAMNSAQHTLVKVIGAASQRYVRYSLATVANMKQNLGFAIVYNLVGAVAIGVLPEERMACLAGVEARFRH